MTMNTRPLKDMIVCVDFDGTCVDHAFPNIGTPMPGAIETLKMMQDAGMKLVLYTCREDDENDINRRFLSDAIEFMESHGIIFRSINETHPEDDFREEGLRRKPYAHVYIDDRNFGGFPGWGAIRRYYFGPQ